MATQSATTKTRAPNLGALSDKIWTKREEIRKLEAQAGTLKEELSKLEEEFLEALQAQGGDKFSGKHCTLSITSSVVAQVEDWDAFWAYIHKKKYGHLLQRRVSDPAYRELLDKGEKVPGVQPFIRKKLNVRSI